LIGNRGSKVKDSRPALRVDTTALTAYMLKDVTANPNTRVKSADSILRFWAVKSHITVS
jgi:hypothetical protein